MSEIQMEYVSPHDLQAAPWNPREITDEAKAKLRRSLEQFGVVDPMILWGEHNLILGGNQRNSIAKEMGIEKVPVVRVPNLAEPEAKALCIALNNPKLQGRFHYPQLHELVREIKAGGFDPTFTGFDSGEVEQMLDWVAPQTGGGPHQVGLSSREGRDRPPEERMQAYLTGTLKQIVLILEQDVYLDTIDKLDWTMEQLGTTDHTSTLLSLLDLYCEQRGYTATVPLADGDMPFE